MTEQEACDAEDAERVALWRGFGWGVVVAAVVCGLLTLGSGCMPVQLSNAPRPGQAQAVALILEAYGAPKTKVPPILWIESPWLDCEDGLGWTVGERCWNGVTSISERHGPYQVKVAWPEGATRITDSRGPFEESNLAHELCHVVFDDSDHVGPCSVEPGVGLIDDATAALLEAGL